MSQTAITFAFEQWKAKEAVNGSRVVLDEFVFANVPGLDAGKPIDRKEGMPPAGQIVHRQAVNKTGVVNNNAVVYSVTLGTEVGDFDFNWIGLVNKASNTVAMIVHAPTQRKVANHAGQQGNAITRSFVMEYDGAASETAITTPAETWQIDFTARLGGIDEMQRLINRDHYGAGAFFGNGFLVAKAGAQYFVTAGTGYVGGVRAVLMANQNITVTAKPIKVWADVSLQGNVVSQWAAAVKFTVAATAADYTDNAGFKHYVFAVASIDAAGNITDLRPQGSLSDQAGNDAYLRKDDNLASLQDKAKSRGSLGLGTAATRNVGQDKGQLLEVGAFGVGGGGFEFNFSNDADLMAALKGRGSCFFRNNKDGTSMPTWGAGFYSRTGDASSMLAISPFSGSVIAAGFTDANTGVPRVNTLYGTANKPKPEDVDAVSASQGGEFKKEIQATGGVTIANSWNSRPGGIFPGNGDYASYDVCNMDIKSWFGIGFYNSCPNSGIQGRTAFMNVRTGDFSAKGRITGAQVWDGGARVYSPANKPTAADVGALTDAQAAQKYALRSIRVNGKPLSADVNLLASDVNAWNKTEADGRYLMLTGGTVNGDIGTQRLVFPGASVVDGAADINRKNGFMIESFSGSSRGYPSELGTLISFTIGENRNAQFAVASGTPDLFLRSIRKDSPGRTEKWTQVYTTDYKPTAADVGALTDAQAAQKYALRSIKVNGKPLTADVNLLAGDVNAWNKTEADGRYVKQAGDTMKGSLTVPYCMTPGNLPEGSGAYAAQLDSKASFYQANFEWEVSTGGHYVPLVKGKSTRKGKGWPTAVSYGYLLPGEDQHAHPVIHAQGDGGVECIWDFNPKTGRISSKAGQFSPLQETMNALYPVGIVAFFGNQTNPNQAFPGQAWEDLSAKGFDRRVLALGNTPLSTGGSNSVRITPHHLPDHSHKGGMRAPGKQWGTMETGTDNSSSYPLGLTTETFTDGMGNEHVRNDLLDVTNAYVNLRGWLRVA
jgi:hypothetical protein